jgi:transcriptional regulator with XRE-family HTH domain
MKDFASVVREARKSKGLTLQAVASKIGSHKGYCSGFEGRKVNPPSPAIVRKLAKFLGLDVLELLILATVEKAPKEVREIMREGSLGMLDASRKNGVTVVEPSKTTTAAAG